MLLINPEKKKSVGQRCQLALDADNKFVLTQILNEIKKCLIKSDALYSCNFSRFLKISQIHTIFFTHYSYSWALATLEFERLFA